MNATVRKCDGCGEYIALYNINNEGVFHEFNFNFMTLSINSKDVLSEKKSSSIYCPRCFDLLNKHINNFIEENGKQFSQIIQPEIYGMPHPLRENAIASKQAQQNFKAVDGTILKDEENN